MWSLNSPTKETTTTANTVTKSTTTTSEAKITADKESTSITTTSGVTITSQTPGMPVTPNTQPETATTNTVSTVMSSIKPPKALVIDDNVSQEWQRWLQHFEWFSLATGLDEKDANIQAATFLCSIGAEAIRKFETFGLTTAETQDIELIKAKFNAAFLPKANSTYERYKFNTLYQVEGELLDEFVTKIKSQAMKCEFGTLENSLVKDRLVMGVKSDAVREKLLSDPELDLEKAIQICRASEQATKQLHDIQHAPAQVNAIRKVQQKTNSNYQCNRCGEKHDRRDCPAYNKRCKKCNKKGHFSKFCRSRRFKRVNEINDETETDQSSDEINYVRDTDDLFVNQIGTSNDDDWTEEIQVKNVPIRFKLDTGAQCNVLTESIAKKLNLPILPSKTKRLTSYSEHKISVLGEISAVSRWKNKSENVIFKVVAQELSPMTKFLTD